MIIQNSRLRRWLSCVALGRVCIFYLQRKKISQVLFHKATGYGQILETG